MPRLKQVYRDEADPITFKLYQAIFGDRGPVSEPGTGIRGDWRTVFARELYTTPRRYEGTKCR
jgi:hypothetical protein